MKKYVTTTISDLRKGDLFTLKPNYNPTDMQVYVRGDYDRSSKKYSCFKFGDVNYERFFVGSKVIYTDFVF